MPGHVNSLARDLCAERAEASNARAADSGQRKFATHLWVSDATQNAVTSNGMHGAALQLQSPNLFFMTRIGTATDAICSSQQITTAIPILRRARNICLCFCLVAVAAASSLLKCSCSLSRRPNTSAHRDSSDYHVAD